MFCVWVINLPLWFLFFCDVFLICICVRPVGRTCLRLFVFIHVVFLLFVGFLGFFLVLVWYVFDWLVCSFVWLVLLSMGFGFLFLLFFVCVRLALCMYVYIICVLWFRLYLLVLVRIIGGSCGGYFLWKEYVSLWLMFFVWDIDFILFCAVVFVGLVICFLVI